MALIALAADKGAPGVTTAAVALGAIWPRAVLVAECDQAGGDLVYRLPGESGMLNPARGLLSLAATARRGLRPEQIAEHSQRLVGGLDVLVGVTNGEQAQGLTWLWGPLGRAFSLLGRIDQMDQIDVIADCGRLNAGTALLDLLREADLVVLLTRATLEHVAHLRERVTALGAELRGSPPIGIVVIADPRDYHGSVAEIDRIVANARLPATVLGGLALDPKGAEMLRGHWGGRLDRSLLIRSAREVAGVLLGRLVTRAGPAVPGSSPSGSVAPAPVSPDPASAGPASGPVSGLVSGGPVSGSSAGSGHGPLAGSRVEGADSADAVRGQ